MWKISLIELLNYYAWPFIDIHLIENPIFKVFIKYIHKQKWVPGIFLGGKGQPERTADNLTAICEPIV
jgi:hypothetical protein